MQYRDLSLAFPEEFYLLANVWRKGWGNFDLLKMLNLGRLGYIATFMKNWLFTCFLFDMHNFLPKYWNIGVALWMSGNEERRKWMRTSLWKTECCRGPESTFESSISCNVFTEGNNYPHANLFGFFYFTFSSLQRHSFGYTSLFIEINNAGINQFHLPALETLTRCCHISLCVFLAWLSIWGSCSLLVWLNEFDDNFTTH